MKKHLLLSLASILIVLGCNKKNSPGPQEPDITVTELTDPDFIQYIEIPGSEKIVFDSALNAYLVTLPASFESHRITIKFKFYPGAYLAGGHSLESSEILDFNFKARPPLYFQVSSSKQKIETYQIYVKHNGTLKGFIHGTEDFQCHPDGNFNIPVEIISGLGTIPETPGSKLELAVILKDDKTGLTNSGTFNQSNLYFYNVFPFLQSESISVTLTYGTKTLAIAQSKKLSKLSAVVYRIAGFGFLGAIPINKKFELFGNGFAATNTYRAKIENEFLTNPIVADIHFEDISKLTCTLPATLPNGSYSFSVFQNDTLINSLATTISTNEKEKSIGQIWSLYKESPTSDRKFFFANKIAVAKGKPIYVNPLPAVMGTMYEGFDLTKRLPDLQLKNAAQTVSIKATVQSDASYADGSIRLYYGEYTPPANLPSGLYEAQLIYADKTVSLPFWSKIEIK